MIQEIQKRPVASQGGLGEGVITGFKSLIENRLQDASRRPVLESLIGIGVDPQSADYISRQPSKIQQQLLSGYQPQQQQQPGIQDQFGQPQQQQQPSSLLGTQSRKEQQQALIAEKKANAAAEKEARGYYQDVLKKAKGAKESDDRLNRMEKLIEKGGLPISGFYNLFKGLEEGGGSLGALTKPVGSILRSIQKITSPNAEEFEKLSNQFIKGAKEIFGSRVTDNDLKAFMAQIPTLGNTDEGKKTIIEGMKKANEAEQLKSMYAKAIVKANGGKVPTNLQEMIDEGIGQELDQLSQEFINAPTR